MDGLLELIGEELPTEDLEELEKQRCQLEEKVEAGQQPAAPQTKAMMIEVLQGFYMLLHQTLEYLENMDPDCERSELIKRKMLADVAYYEDLLSQKRRKPMQSTLNSWFKKRKPSSSEAPTSNEPQVIEEPLTSDEPQPSTSTGGYTCPNVPLPSLLPLLSSSSDVDDPDVI